MFEEPIIAYLQTQREMSSFIFNYALQLGNFKTLRMFNVFYIKYFLCTST